MYIPQGGNHARAVHSLFVAQLCHRHCPFNFRNGFWLKTQLLAVAVLIFII